MRTVGTSVPGAAPGRPLIDAVVAVVVEEMLRERRDGLGIGQRRHGAHPGTAAIDPATLHRKIVGWPEGPGRLVAGRAGDGAGRGEPRVHEQLSTQRGEGGHRRAALEARRVDGVR